MNGPPLCWTIGNALLRERLFLIDNWEVSDWLADLSSPMDLCRFRQCRVPRGPLCESETKLSSSPPTHGCIADFAPELLPLSQGPVENVRVFVAGWLGLNKMPRLPEEVSKITVELLMESSSSFVMIRLALVFNFVWSEACAYHRISLGK